MAISNPLVLTAGLDRESTRFFNEQRKIYFPPERNFLEAHLTLFHHLPPEDQSLIQTLENAALNIRPFTMQVTGVVFTGRGVAYKIESDTLVQLHKTLLRQWKPLLTPQDSQGLWPHITVQNKVAPAVAKALQQELSGPFQPFDIQAEGLILWEYLGGPWRLFQTFGFSG